MQPAAGAKPMGPKRNPRNEGLTVGGVWIFHLFRQLGKQQPQWVLIGLGSDTLIYVLPG